MYHYDSLPYASDPFAETHPQTLAMLAQLLGVPAAPPAACRVLELGCAAGGNLIPMAWHLRGSEFVGIDLEQRHVDEGRSVIAELDLQNITLRQGDIALLGEELGEFDYIIAHGVFSWVPQAVREAMLSLYGRLLKPQGIGYISYNTSPGWHVRGMVREMVLFHTRGIDDPLARLNAAMAFIDMYAETLRSQTAPLSRHLLLELESLQVAHPSYVYHEYLEADNQPLLFSDFVGLAGRHGLRYLCESRLESMFPSGLGEQAERFLERLDGSASHEQYLDFFSQRTFRQTLLVHDNVRPDYDIDLERLEGLACASNLTPPTRLDLRGPTAQTFVTTDGRDIDVADPVAKAMLAALYESYPSALSLHEVSVAAREVVTRASRRHGATVGDAWHGELFGLYANCLVQLVPEPQHLDNAVPALPHLNALGRSWLARGAQNLPTVWHQPLNLDAFARRLAGHLDGRHDRAALLQQLHDDIANGQLALPGPAPAAARLHKVVASNLDRLLALFAQNGILARGGD